MSCDRCDLEGLSRVEDAVLLDQLENLVRAGRRVTAALVAHLAAVDERRLHLRAGFGSLFSYCVARHGMSEDEACRRIEAARLARRFPMIVPMLARGEITLTVVSLVKPHLRDDNQHDLLRDLAGNSVRAAREVLAARFPCPDAPSSIRKLPERSRFSGMVAAPNASPHSTSSRPAASTIASDLTRATDATQPTTSPLTTAAQATSTTQPLAPYPRCALGSEHPAISEPATNSATLGKLVEHASSKMPEPPAGFARATSAERPRGGRGRASRVEPSAAGRYRVEFAAGAMLKEKLERARDWMRHRNPSGDFAVIFENALDLLLT